MKKQANINEIKKDIKQAKRFVLSGLRKERVKKKHDNDMMLYLNFCTTLKEYFSQYKILTHKYQPTNYTMLINEKRNEIEQILERLRKALDVISITDFVDLK